MTFRLVLSAILVPTVFAFATPVGAATPLVEFTDNGFVPAAVVLDAIQLNAGASLAIHNASSQDVTFCEQVSGLCQGVSSGGDSGFGFDAAETTVISTPQFPQARLVVGVPMRLVGATRAGITVRWVSHPTPDPDETAPARFDVQWRQDTSERHPRWHDFAAETANVVGTFVPPHPGHYVFRARLCDNFGGLVSCSMWSPELKTRV
jgi:hypothetical protein